MQNRTQKITLTAMFCALAYAVVAVGRIPVVLFLKYDPKDVVITLSGLILGPITALLVSVISSFIEMLTVSDTGIIGYFMNILSSCSFACIAAIIYKRKKTLSGAIIGLILGCVAMVVVMLLWNYIITPLYMGFPREAVVELLLPAFLPFNLLKGSLNAAITFLLYKPVIKALRSNRLMPYERNYIVGIVMDIQNTSGYTIYGNVIHGRGIGKLINMPTANLNIEDIKDIPKTGVYISRTYYDGKQYIGVTHIGLRPTVDRDKYLSVETHLIAFNGNLYGKRIEINLIKKLREVHKFSSMSKLREQVYKDCSSAKKYFEQVGESVSQDYTKIIVIDGLTVNIVERTVTVANKVVELTPKEYSVLLLLAQNKDVAFTKEKIYETIWEEPANGYCHSVENIISQLRKKIPLKNKGDHYIDTIKGYGYKLNSR